MTIYKDWFIFSGSVALLVCNILLAEGIEFTLTPSSIQPGQKTSLEIRLPIDWLKNAGWRENEDLPLINDELLSNSNKFTVLENF